MPLRRLKSGPVGRVARRRSGIQASRARSLLLQSNRAQSQKQSSPAPAPASSQSPDQSCAEPRESPGRNFSPGHPPEKIVLSPSTGSEVRESQLI